MTVVPIQAYVPINPSTSASSSAPSASTILGQTDQTTISASQIGIPAGVVMSIDTLTVDVNLTAFTAPNTPVVNPIFSPGAFGVISTAGVPVAEVALSQVTGAATTNSGRLIGTTSLPASVSISSASQTLYLAIFADCSNAASAYTLLIFSPSRVGISGTLIS